MKRPTALAAAWLILIGLPVTVTHATDALATLHHSFDVTVQRVGKAGPTFDDHEVISETTVPEWSATALGSLPSGADLTALHKATDGRWYFSLDTFVTIGGVHVGPEDVVAWSGITYELVFDGSLAGIPAGAAVDALAEAPGYGLLLSFDVSIPIGLLVIDDEDLVAWNGTTLSLAFDGSGFGIPAALDLDALDYDASDETLYLSFDGSGQLGGVDFDDHDILHFDDVSWTKVAYAGLAESGTGAADLDALDFVTASIFIFSDGFEDVGSD